MEHHDVDRETRKNVDCKGCRECGRVLMMADASSEDSLGHVYT